MGKDKGKEGRRQLKKYVSITLACLFLILITTGCVEAPVQGKPGGEAPVVISVWYSLEGTNEQALLKQFERINQERSEVIIKADKVAESAFVDKIWKLQAGGEGPEIIITSRPTMYALYKKGAISPVLVEDDNTYSAAEAGFVFDHQSFAASWLGDVPLLYYRKDKILEPPSSLMELMEKKSAIGIKAMSATLLSPWWKAEGGMLSLKGIPAVDDQVNGAFVRKLQFLKSEGLLYSGDQAQEKFKSGEINYFLGWSSDRLTLEHDKVEWACMAMPALLGSNANVLLDQNVGIANTSIKTVPVLENAIRLVEEELLKVSTQADMQKAGGKVPLSKHYYEDAVSGSFEAQVAFTLEKAWILEGSAIDWTLIPLYEQKLNTPLE